jgi:hypothetical protein
MVKLFLWPGSRRSKREVLRMALTIFLLGCLINTSFSQKQLIFLKQGNVVARFSEGSYFKCVLKDGTRKEGVIQQLNEFSMIASFETINFSSIAKMDVRSQHHFNIQSGIGGLFFLGGIIYLVVDGANKALGYTAGGFDSGDAYALAFTAAGAAMIFIKPRYLRLTDQVIIRTIDRDSQYYLSGE